MSWFDKWARSVGTDPDPRFTLANERTFLSWMSTALGCLGVGLALGTIVPERSAAITYLAMAWILMSLLVTVRSVSRWWRIEQAVRLGRGLPLSSSIPLLAAGLGVLALLSGALVLAVS